MKKLLLWTAALATLFSGVSMAQTMTLFAPPERDFRVLLPAPPQRQDTPQGSVEYRAEAGQRQYSVFRHDPGRLSGANPQNDIVARIANDDQSARRYGQDEGELTAGEFIFRVGSIWTIHKVIIESGRYYELVVKSPADDGVDLSGARDFFTSFQMGTATGFPVAANLPGPDSCQSRSNAFSRRFCEYMACLAPGTASHAVCQKPPGLFRN
jgi:hypothetical protein